MKKMEKCTLKQKKGDFLGENILKLDYFRGFQRCQTRSTPAENQISEVDARQ